MLSSSFGKAACAGTDTSIFYSTEPEVIQLAKTICGQCPIKQLCYEYALLHERDGIWGGVTPKARSRFKSKQHADYQEIVYKYIKKGGLEPHHIVSTKVVSELRGIYEVQVLQKKYERRVCQEDLQLNLDDSFVSPQFSL